MTVKNIRNRNKNANRNSLALYQALAKARQFELAEKTEITLPVRLALDNLFKGEQSEEDVLTLYTAIRIGLIATSEVEELHKICNSAKAVIAEVFKQLVHQDLSMKIHNSEKNDILNAIEIYEAIVDQITPYQMVDLLEKVEAQIHLSDFVNMAKGSPSA
jgi:ERCC4-related helicase